MLTHLKIRNYALIKKLEIDFHQQMNIITGETGAGKSILMGALALILGERADSQALMSKDEKCIVEGSFAIAAYRLHDFFKANDLDYDDESIIRREISESGKSRAFINDTPVNLSLLKELGNRLVDIHSQHQTLELNSRELQMEILDIFSGAQEELLQYRQAYQQYHQAQKQLQQLEQEEAEARREQDYKQFLFNELEEARLQADEQESIEQELNTLNNAEEIQQALQSSSQLLNDEEQSVINRLQQVKAMLAKSARYNGKVEELQKRIEGNIADLKDIAAECEDTAADIVADKNRQEMLNQRLDLIFSLQKKHRCNNIEELLSLQKQLETDLGNIGSLQEQIQALQEQLHKEKAGLQQTAKAISDKRKKHIPGLEKNIKDLLGRVGMPHAALQVKQDLLNEDDFNQNGLDQISFLFASNKGSSYQPLHKVASGGELSRLMLCIKTVIARLSALPTIIFDEIDTGISGETAMKVGEVMKELAEQHQVLCITHLPQIAAKGEHHYFVYKESGKNSTSSNIRLLNEEERIEEIAKMLSGAQPTASALANARELVAG